ncbi:MAG: DNRLRE domain-containing protein [Clostridiales Family XIII bacterium]|jgi:RHS repeat-associated protein|nr:DNRLRE domain-containing protein [Clostridiales Family XIII bacterium]
MKKRITRRILGILLITALIAPMFTTPAAVLAEDMANAPRATVFDLPEENTDPEYPPAPPEPELREPELYAEEIAEPEGELVDLTEYSKVYKTGETTYVTEVSGTKQAYKDEKNRIVPIDNTLDEKDPLFGAPYFENRENDLTAQFPFEIKDGKGVTIEKDGNSVEMIPMSGDFSHPVAKENSVLYNNAEDGIDYQYTVIGDTVKEDIILNRQVDKERYDFELKAKNLTPVLNETDNTVELYEKSAEIPFFILSAPQMTDASGEASTDIKITLAETEGKHIVTLIPDKAWLSDLSRAYPVRIDPTVVTVALTKMSMVGVQQDGPNTNFNNGYPYAGYDDGIATKNLELFESMHMMTRAYIGLDYRFLKVPKDAKIDSATFSIHHYTSYSDGATLFGLYLVQNAWNPDTITWNSQTGYNHEFIALASANVNAGYISWDVRETVNNWVQEITPNHGFVIKAEPETSQCEVFSKRDGEHPPTLQVTWSIPDPVDPDMNIDNIELNLRPISEKNIAGKLLFDGIFADGIAKPGSTVDYRLLPDDIAGQTKASYKYEYPNSTAFNETYPNGTKYLDKLANWQTDLFSGLDFDKAYRFGAKATYFDEDTDVTSTSAEEKLSEKFLIYRVKQRDTFPYIANYYGVPLNTIMRDNRVQDALVIDNNTIFIRDPKTEVPYNPPPLSEAQMRAIDRALIGRGLHCEYGFEPVNLNTGNFIMEQTDATILDIEEDFSIERTYNSKGENYQSIFGRRWNFKYAESLSGMEDGRIAYFAGDGKTLFFTPNGQGGYDGPAGYFYDLKKIAYETVIEGENVTLYRYEIHEAGGAYRKFNAWGLLTDVYTATGLGTQISYDENYNIREITSPTGKKYGFSADSAGRVSAITLPDGGILEYNYDEAGNLTGFTDAMGNTVRYEYDASGLMTASYDQNGNRTVKNVYDGSGRVTEQYDAKDAKITFSYTENGTTTTDANGNVTKYTYDSNLRTTKIEYPDGEVIEKAYGPNNTLLREDDITYTYDAKGNRLTETRVADGRTKHYEYDAKCLPIRITDFDGQVTLLEYSGSGDLIKTTRADGKYETYEYDAYHRLTAYTDVGGGRTVYTYAGAAVASVTNPNGETTSYGYDAMNRLVSVKDPLGGISRIIYDKNGKATGRQGENGNLTSYVLDKAGNALTTTDPRGYKTSAVLDKTYNVVKVTDPKGGALSFAYDKNGNKRTETDALGRTSYFEYDSRNRLIKETAAGGGITKYTYDKKGRLTKQEDAEGAITQIIYDEALDLPIKEIDALGAETIYEYDAAGQLTKVTNPDGTSVSYTYNEARKPSLIIDETGKTTRISYAGKDKAVALTENDVRHYALEYDAAGNLIRKTDPMGGVFTYEYDAAGRIVTETDESGRRTEYAYDAAGRLTKVTDALGHATEMTYDGNGNVTEITDAKGNTTAYTYDALNLVISAIDAEGGITNYTYDAAENPLTVTDPLKGVRSFAYNILNLPERITDENGDATLMEYSPLGNNTKITLPNGTDAEMEYDLLGRLIKETDPAGVITEYVYDAMGRVLSEKNSAGGLLLYDYDNFGRLIKITDELGRTETNTYDAFSQIVEKKDTGNTLTKYAYDLLGRGISETRADGASSSAAYDPVGNLISEKQPNGGIYTYTYDAANNPTSVQDPLGHVTAYEYDEVYNLTGITDAKETKTSYAYDKLGRLTEETNALGDVTAYQYDALSRQIARTSPEGGMTEYRYDPAGNLTKIKDPVGNITEYIYDELESPIREISPKGGVTEYEYDAHGYLTKETDPEGGVTKYNVRADGLTEKITLPNGGIYTYAYDAAGRITEIIAPEGLTRTFAYDKNGNLAEETDNLGRTISYSYDIMHNLTNAVNPLGIETALSYDVSGNLTSLLTADGAETNFAYDLMGRQTAARDAEGKETTRTYDPLGNLTGVTEPAERTTLYSYDKIGNLTDITDPMDYRTSYSFDGDSRLISQTDAMENSILMDYDPAGRLIKQTDPLNYTVLLSYDADGNITKLTNPLGAETKYTYDKVGNLTSVKDPMQRLTEYSYDKMGNLTELTDADGKKTAYTYDLEGNVTSVTDPTGKIKAFEYDMAGRLSKATDPGGKSVAYDYDKLNALVSKAYSDEESANVLYAYDEMGRRVSMTDGSGASAYEYDILGRVSKVTDAKGREIGYAYNEADLLSKITYPDGRSVLYGYDKNDRLTSVTDELGTTSYEFDPLGRVTGISRPGGTATAYSYDENGNLTDIANTDAGGKVISSFAYEYDGQGYIVTETAKDAKEDAVRHFEYNAAGELTVFAERTGSGSVRYAYAYDDSGNRIKQARTGSGANEVITYEYDEANRLIKEDSSLAGQTAYRYDENGNVTSKDGAEQSFSYEYTVENRLKAVREGGSLLMAAAYDGDGNRIFRVSRKSIIYDSSAKAETSALADSEDSGEGIATEKEPKRKSFFNVFRDLFSYGFWTNAHTQVRILTIANTELDESIEGRIFGFWHKQSADTTYDASDTGAVESLSLPESETLEITSGILIPEEPTGAADGYIYELTYYVNDVNRENAEVLQEYGGSGKLTETYTYGIDRLTNDSEGAADSSYYLYDGRGSVSDIVTNSAGILASYTYGPFGEARAGIPAEETIYGYNGEEYNPLTGLQYLRARYFDTESGRFTAEDTYEGSIGDPLSHNKYAYTKNNPVNYTDPSGHLPKFLETAVNGIKKAANWVNDKVIKPVASAVNKYVVQPVKSAVSAGVKAVKNSPVGKVVAEKYDQAKTYVKQTYTATKSYVKQKAEEITAKVNKFVCSTKERIGTFIEEHKQVLKVVAAVAVIAVLAVATVATGGVVGAVAAGALAGALIGGGSGAVIGGIASKATGGSFADGAVDGFFWGTIGGAVSGGVGGAFSGAASGTTGAMSGIVGSTAGRSVIESAVDTSVGVAQTLSGGGAVTAGSLAADFGTNLLMETATGGAATPGTGKQVKNAVEDSVRKEAKSSSQFINENVHPSFRRNVSEAFEDDVMVSVLEDDKIAYRYYGGDSNEKSYWYTPNMTSNPVADLALPIGNSYDNVEKVIIPKGTEILEGTVAPNFGQKGGAIQYYVPDPSVIKKVG